MSATENEAILAAHLHEAEAQRDRLREAGDELADAALESVSLNLPTRRFHRAIAAYRTATSERQGER